jgi:phage shock protein A
MAESIFMRVRRLISASIEDAVDAMERAGGPSVMREAIREVDRAIDDVRAEQEAATARRLQATRQQKMFRDKLAALGEQARFAMAENRDDLAEAAVSRQLDFEAQAERLEAVQAEAASEAARLEECLVALATRKSQMEEALAAFESAQRDAAIGGDGPRRPERCTERKVQRAEGVRPRHDGRWRRRGRQPRRRQDRCKGRRARDAPEERRHRAADGRAPFRSPGQLTAHGAGAVNKPGPCVVLNALQRPKKRLARLLSRAGSW